MNNLLDRAILTAWLLLASGAGMVLYIGTKAQATAGGGGPAIQLVYAVFYMYFTALLVVRFRTSLAVLIQEKWIFILWLWAFASTVWSPLPGTTLRRTIGLLGTTAVGLFVATRFEPRQQLRILAHCVGLTAAASLVACLLFPDYAIAQTGEWTGVFYQKNALGHMMALGIFSYTFLLFGQRRGRLVSILGIALCAGMLLMSKSVTALIVCTLMLIVLRFRKLLVLRSRALIGFAAAFLTITIPLGIYALRHAGDILRLLGRDATLTGRVPLWNAVLDEISTRPWTGFGYSAFWFTPEAARVQAILGWPMTHSHDGYLEITLALGLIGLTLTVITLVSNIFRGIHVTRGAETIFDFWPLFYLIFTVADNITESWFMAANSLFWMFFVANSYWIVREHLYPATEEEDDTPPSAEFALSDPTENPLQS